MAIKFKKNNQNEIRLSSVDKSLRKVLKEKQDDLNKNIEMAFGAAISETKATKENVEQALKVNGNNSLLSTISADIKYTKNGSIDRRSLPKILRKTFNEVETTKKTEFELAMKRRISDTKNLTIDDLTKMNEISKKMKKPFNGKFIEEK